MEKMVLLAAYIIGVVVDLVLVWRAIDKGQEVTFAVVFAALLISACSWPGLVVALLIRYGDKVLFVKK